MAKEVKAWVTIKGKHIPIFEGESSQDAYNRVVAKENEEIKERQIAQRAAEVERLNPSKNAQAKRDAEYTKTAWNYFKNLSPEKLDDYESQFKGNKIALEQIKRAKRRHQVLKYYSSVPAELVPDYIKKVSSLQGDERVWALEGLRMVKRDKK